MNRSHWIIPVAPVAPTAAELSMLDQLFRLDSGKIVTPGANLNSTRASAG